MPENINRCRVQPERAPMRLTTVLLMLALLGGVLTWQTSVPSGSATQVAYPEGYRGWTHVKSSLIGPAHRNFATNGGFQHTYANAEAMKGYRTRQFPEGSIIAFDRLDMIDKDGAMLEGPRRGLDVMAKDSTRFATTGGWGFQRFVKDSKTELAATPTPQQCFACHESLKKDGLVLSSYRP
ncbi:MAG: cytochrome P460 family protein [Gammaproteobacteria bacterium]